MNLWFRLIWLLVTTRFRPRLDLPADASVLPFRVWFHDLDTSLHMNNGRYWTLMDLGRLDLMLRSGLWRAVLRHRWLPVVNAGTIRFRREMRLFRPFRVETQILCAREATRTEVPPRHAAAPPRLPARAERSLRGRARHQRVPGRGRPHRRRR